MCLAIAGAVLCAGVALHEWSYYQDHPHRTGVAGVLVVLALGAALGCAAVALIARIVGRLDDSESRN